MDARRQAAVAALAIVGRFDLIRPSDQLVELHGIGLRSYREMLRFVGSQWASVADGFGGEAAALAALGVKREEFFEVFGNDLDASEEVRAFALKLIDEEGPGKGASEPAIRLIERVRPGSGFLYELCLKSFKYRGRHNWESYSTALTTGQVLGRNFGGDKEIEKRLTTILEMNKAILQRPSSPCVKAGRKQPCCNQYGRATRAAGVCRQPLHLNCCPPAHRQSVCWRLYRRR